MQIVREVIEFDAKDGHRCLRFDLFELPFFIVFDAVVHRADFLVVQQNRREVIAVLLSTAKARDGANQDDRKMTATKPISIFARSNLIS